MISSLATHFRVAIEAHSSLLDEVSVSVCRDHLRHTLTLTSSSRLLCASMATRKCVASELITV